MTIRVIPGHICRICKEKIVMQIFRGTGVCCELCRKVDIGEITKEEAHVQRLQ